VRDNIVRRPGITVRNYTGVGKTFEIAVSFRYPDDEARGGIQIKAPRRVFVSGNGIGSFGVEFRVRTGKLDPWTLNSGANGANADLLSKLEYDGYITLTNVANPNEVIRLPWQILPRAAGEIALAWKNNHVKVSNVGAGTSTVESYSLIAENGNQPEGEIGGQSPKPDFRYVGYATYPVPAGVCSANPSFVMAFAANTFEQQTHSNYPFLFEVDIDADQDGDSDYAVFTAELPYPSFATDGRNVTYVLNLNTGSLGAFFFTDHDMKSGNTVMLICAEQIGMTTANFLDPMDIAVFAVDNYFTGNVTDFFEGITISPLGEQYLALFENGGVGATTLAPKQNDKLRFLDFGETTNNTESGLLLLYRGGAQRWVEAGVLYASK
jgi:hypothetical protein